MQLSWPRVQTKEFVTGYRIPKPLDEQLKELSLKSGFSKLHLLEIALQQFLAKREPLEW